MDHCFEANEIKSNDKKRSIFLSVIGAKTYKLLQGQKFRARCRIENSRKL